MDKKICLLCGNKLRKTKKVDIVDREYHFKCIDEMRKQRYEEELKDFIQFLTEQINKLDII